MDFHWLFWIVSGEYYFRARLEIGNCQGKKIGTEWFLGFFELRDAGGFSEILDRLVSRLNRFDLRASCFVDFCVMEGMVSCEGEGFFHLDTHLKSSFEVGLVKAGEHSARKARFHCRGKHQSRVTK